MPSDMAVTFQPFAALATRLATTDLGILVALLVDQLDARAPDPDREPERSDTKLCLASQAGIDNVNERLGLAPLP